MTAPSLTPSLDGGEWSAAPGIHCVGNWSGPRPCLDFMENEKFFTLPGLELRPFGRPVRS
jgi:hypothetical protein